MRQFLADIGLFVLITCLACLGYSLFVLVETHRIERNRLRLLGEFDWIGSFRHHLQLHRFIPYALIFSTWSALYGAETISGRIVLGTAALALTFMGIKRNL